MDQMIQAVFFDFDGVLSPAKTGTGFTCEFLARETGIPYDTLRAAFEPYRLPLARGQATRDETWPLVCRAAGRDIPRELLARSFEATPLDAAMFAYANSLGRHGRVGIVTDNPKDRFDIVRRVLWLDRIFDPIVVSAEEGVTKDDPEVFRRAVAKARVTADAAVFIDNVRENVDVAVEAGLHGVFYDDEKRDLAALTRELLALGVA
jgi:putative hydrolase of the HAD superfamily